MRLHPIIPDSIASFVNEALAAFLHAHMHVSVKNLTASVKRGEGLGLLKRLQTMHAAIIGAIYGYPSEPLTGTDRPCPPGPGLQQQWGCLVAPIIFINIPSYYWGQEQRRLYRDASQQETATPANDKAQSLVRCIRDKIAQYFPDRVGTVSGQDMGRIRSVWPYASDRKGFADKDFKMTGFKANQAIHRARAGPASSLCEISAASSGEFPHEALAPACTTVMLIRRPSPGDD